MDREQFDTLARLVWRKQPRRATLGALLGAVALGLVPVSAKPKPKDKRLRRRKRKPRPRRPCYPGRSCIPGQGRDNSGCDFSRGVAFFQRNAQGSNLSRANFTDAQMAEANFQGADLGGACLVGANLLGAVIDGSTSLKGAIFCNTLMTDGSINYQDCGKGTRCCPAPMPPTCQGEECASACIGAPNAQCSFNVPYGGCCPGLRCVPSSTTPIELTCQAPCGNDTVCHRFGAAWHCASAPQICRYLGGQCCQHI